MFRQAKNIFNLEENVTAADKSHLFYHVSLKMWERERERRWTHSTPSPRTTWCDTAWRSARMEHNFLCPPLLLPTCWWNMGYSCMENHWYLNHCHHTILAVERHQSKRLVVAKELSLDEEDGLSLTSTLRRHMEMLMLLDDILVLSSLSCKRQGIWYCIESIAIDRARVVIWTLRSKWGTASLREVPNYCMITEAVCRLTEATGDVAILPCDPEKIIKREGFS